MRVLLILILLGSVSSYGVQKDPPYFDKGDLTPYWAGDAGSGAHHPATVEAFHVTNQHGREITEKQFSEGLSLVNFFFADCPGLCPTMMRALRAFRGRHPELTGKVKIYSFSVQPDKDSPTVLKAYAKEQKIDQEDWNLLTGQRREIFRVGREMFKADGSAGADKKASKFIHTRNVYLVDSQRHIRGIYDTSDRSAMDLLAKDIGQLAFNRPGTVAGGLPAPSPSSQR